MNARKKVICVVLAGGFGTRLCPLTDTKPKPLVKILDTTVLEQVICALKKTEAQRIIVSTFYKTDMIEKKCREIDKKILCKREKIPLGTAGGVKNCVDGDYDAVLVVSGDGVFDFDLQKALGFHFEKNNDVTIITSHKENPTQYGVVLCSDDGIVSGFDEKPSWKKVKSDRVNTGIYILSQNAIESIPDMKEYDFSNNLFPHLLKEGRRIMSFDGTGFWCDIGTIGEYYNCNCLAADGKIDCVSNDGLSRQELFSMGIHSDDGVYVSPSAKIGKNVSIGRGSIICENSVICDNCDISSSVISENSFVGKGSSINGAIIGEWVSVGENCIVQEGTVIGGRCRIADGTVLGKNLRIGAETAVGKGAVQMDLFGERQLFMDEGRMVFGEKNVFKEVCDAAASISISFRKNENTGTGFAVMSSPEALHLKDTLVSVFSSKNDTVFDCGTGNEAMLSFSVRRLDADAGLFLSQCDGKLCITIFNEKGEIIDEKEERKISKVFLNVLNDEDVFTSSSENKGRRPVFPMDELYRNSLNKYFLQMLSGAPCRDMKICMHRDVSEKNASGKILCDVLKENGVVVTSMGNEDVINVAISNDGKRANLRIGNRFYDHEHVCAAVLKNRDLLGLKNAVPGKNIPSALKNYTKDTDGYASGISALQDGCGCICAFLALLVLRGERADVILSEIPAFEIYTDDFVADINRGATMERLSRLYNDTKYNDGDGIRLSLAEGDVTIIPNRMKGFRIISEAASMEAAKELAFKIGKVIKNEQ